MFRSLFNRRKRTPQPDLGEELSPEADKFLAEATAEFNVKQEALKTEWRFGQAKDWNYEQADGIFKLNFADGTQFLADGQILGSYCSSDDSWEWAWNNPNADARVAEDSKLVKAVGKKLGLDYLTTGMIPVPGEAFISYLSAIGIKAVDAIGVYRGDAGPIDVLIMLKNPRVVRAE